MTTNDYIRTEAFKANCEKGWSFCAAFFLGQCITNYQAAGFEIKSINIHEDHPTDGRLTVYKVEINK